MKKKEAEQQDLYCSISHMTLRHPIYVAPHYYELAELLKWLKTGNVTAPMTQQEMTHVLYDEQFKQQLDELKPDERYDDYDHVAPLKELQSYFNDYASADLNKTGVMVFFPLAALMLLIKCLHKQPTMQPPQADLIDMMLCLFVVAGCSSLYKMYQPAQGFFNSQPPGMRHPRGVQDERHRIGAGSLNG